MILLIFFSISSTEISGQNIRAGLDISSIFHEKLIIDFEYGFSDNWSAGGETGLNLSTLKSKKSHEETEHRQALDYDKESYTSGFRNIFQETGVYIQYWPQRIFSGPSILIGGIFMDRKVPDITLGICYSFKIWKNIGAGITCKTFIIDSIKQQNNIIDIMQIKFNYTF